MEKLPSRLTKEEAARFLNTAKQERLDAQAALLDLKNSGSKWTKRARNRVFNALRAELMMRLYLMAGPRLMELTKLDDDRLYLGERRFKVIGKGSKHNGGRERYCTIDDVTWRLFNRYMKAREEFEVPCYPQPTFIGRTGERVSNPETGQICRRLGRKAGINKVVHPHMLRHTCGSLMAEAGKPLQDIAHQLGHRSLQSTGIYIELATTKKEESTQELANMIDHVKSRK